mmetsp:Transcript_8652/g.14914  ORF Transcript_8652/g.14914 Transcript_8652/m.14914 type:complete len:355 (-) Transcript_8652:285-1349(-)
MAVQTHGVASDVSQACALLRLTSIEALEYVGGSAEMQGTGFRSPWREFWSQKYERYYYCNDTTGYNSWTIPKPVQLREWMMDAELYTVDIQVARALFRSMQQLLDTNWAVPRELWSCVALLAKIVGNISGCGNSNPKFRTVKADNAAIRDKVLALDGAGELLLAAGFTFYGGVYTFAAAAPAMMMHALVLVAAKLQQLHDKRGFTGGATFVKDDAVPGQQGAPQQTAWHGTPGFRWQTNIYECSSCQQPINDGSERLFSRSHDAPVGQFRYECTQCLDSQHGYHLCEGCWDKLQSGQHLHTAGHTFRTHHPRASRHGMNSQETESNPWGVALGQGGSATRALARLHGRTGWPGS